MDNIYAELEGKEYIAGIYDDYDIRMCREDEYEDLRSFFRQHWRKDHIFVLSKEILDFQHLNKDAGTYNFVIAKEKKSNEIHAILGFVTTSQFDREIKRTMLWPCIWKKSDHINRKGLGVALHYHLSKNFEIETIAALGITETALSIHKRWNYDIGKMEHFVMPNFKADDHLAKGLSGVYKSFDTDRKDDKVLMELSRKEYLSISADDPIFSVNSIYKSKGYYLNRFLNHPVYSYVFLGVLYQENIDAIIVGRCCGDGAGKCLRIVDFVGDVANIINVRNQLQDYLQKNDYEYVDFVEVGLQKDILQSAGFINRRENDGVIVPNYFEPFLQENIDLDYAYKTVVSDSKEIIFKADADQDRPNIL